MNKPKYFKCPHCGKKVFWRYFLGKKILYQTVKNPELIGTEHTCWWSFA